MNQDEVRKLTTYIEENLRSSPSSGLAFVDTRNFLTRLCSKQNHVVFGRRGAGKTCLVQAPSKNENYIYVYINLEDYKDITFPNIVIKTLLEMFNILDKKIKKHNPFYRFSFKANRIRKSLKSTCYQLNKYLYEPDEETQNINTKEAYSDQFSADLKLDTISAGASSGMQKTKEVKRTLLKNKLDFLRIELSTYKKLIIEISSLFSNKPIFLVLDDFYFVIKDTQPELVDYFHRLTKGTNLFIKLATIKHRSKLYRRANERITGVELAHDIFEVDMDYTLNNFDELQFFMRQLLNKAIKGANANMLIEDIFSGEAFSQLCLASGGVPRDFLSLFVILGNKLLVSQDNIGKIDVTEAAMLNVNTKIESMKKDSGDEDVILEDYLAKIRKYVFSIKRTNCFLVAKDELETNVQLKQAIRELVDLRLLHLIDDNTSKAPSDGRRYEAYILDLGLYDNSRPRNFKQIDPSQRDERSRKDELRASPVVSKEELEKQKAEKQGTIQRVNTLQPELGLTFE